MPPPGIGCAGKARARSGTSGRSRSVKDVMPRLLRQPPSPRAGESFVLTTVPEKEEARPGRARALAMLARRKPLGAIGATILLALVGAAILAPAIAPFDP